MRQFTSLFFSQTQNLKTKAGQQLKQYKMSFKATSIQVKHSILLMSTVARVWCQFKNLLA